MKSADIMPRTWYYYDGRYANSGPLFLLGIERYSLTGRRDGHELIHTPTAQLGTPQGYPFDRTTGFLGVALADTEKAKGALAMRKWAVQGAPEAETPEIVGEAVVVLDRVVAEITVRGAVPADEINTLELYERGMTVVIVQPRDVVGDFVLTVREHHQQAVAEREARRQDEQAESARRQRLEAALAVASKLGLNTDRYRGGAHELWGSYGRYRDVEMSAEHYGELVDEIARLRELVAKTITADESGEGKT